MLHELREEFFELGILGSQSFSLAACECATRGIAERFHFGLGFERFGGGRGR